MRKFFALTVLATMLVGSAGAGSIFSGFVPTGTKDDPQRVKLNDTNFEVITKGSGNTGTKFEVGDSVTLYLKFDNIDPTKNSSGQVDEDHPLAGGANYQFLGNGVFDVVSIDNEFTGGTNNDVDFGDISFTGIIDFFETTDSSIDLFPDGGDASDAESALSGLSSFMSIGTKSGTDDFILAEQAILGFADIPVDGGVTANFGLSLLSGGEGLPVATISEGLTNDSGLGTGTFHDFTGFITATSTGDDTLNDDVFDLSTDTTMFFRTVPEPGSIAIWATLALGGCLAARRRLASKS